MICDGNWARIIMNHHRHSQPLAAKPRDRQCEHAADRGYLQLTLHFLITHLLQSDGDGGGNGKHVSAFVVQYYASRPISLMEDVFPSLQEHRPHAAPSSIEEVVQRVQTYRALDYNGMSEAVARISAVLAELHAPQGTPSANYENVRSEHHHQPILLIIDGLDQSLSDLSRTTASVLTAQARTVRLLRELSSLSRRYPRSLAILVLNALGLPHITAPVDNGSFVNPFPPVTSAFGPPPAPLGQGQSHGQDHQNRGEGLARKNPYVSPLARTFDQVLFDAHLLVSKVGDGIAVEVVKDRLGDGKGRWCGL